MILYGHPFSSYYQKVLIAFYENRMPIELRLLEGTEADPLRDAKERDPRGVADARALLDRSYSWLDARLSGREWAAGGSFSLADCAAAPSLFYADWVQPIDPALSNLTAYRRRLLARPSFARAVDEARPYRVNFPPGAPDRD